MLFATAETDGDKHHLADFNMKLFNMFDNPIQFIETIISDDHPAFYRLAVININDSENPKASSDSYSLFGLAMTLSIIVFHMKDHKRIIKIKN